jgi:hypothetical protein
MAWTVALLICIMAAGIGIVVWYFTSGPGKGTIHVNM